MAPVEWPIAARSEDRGAVTARRVDRDRLSTVRADFFLDPKARLTEQERALMTAMLADLVTVVADEVRAAGNHRSNPANDHSDGLFERLSASGLLDIPQLIALLLRRAEQEHVAAALRPRGNGGHGRFLHSLAADADAGISAAAMALVLGRSRRRDRFDAPRIDLDDVPAEAAVRFVYAVTAAVRAETSATGSDGDRRLAEAAAAVLARHDEGKRMEALCFALLHALDCAGRLDEEVLRSALGDAEVALVVEGLSRRAGVDFETAWTQLVSGGRELASLLRMAGVPRRFAAELVAALGDAVAGDPAEVIGRFDAITDEEVERTRGLLRLDRAYRDSIAALGGTHGDAAD